MNATRSFVPIAIFVVLAVLFCHGLFRDPGVAASPLVGQPAPQFSAADLQDPSIEIGSADFTGQISLLNVWGAWCAQCLAEHEFLVRLATDGRIPIYGLNVWDDRARAIDWLTRLGNPYVGTVYDEDGMIAIDWGVTGAPETFLIGPDSTVLHRHISVLTPEVWEAEFVPIVLAVCRRQPCALRSE